VSDREANQFLARLDPDPRIAEQKYHTLRSKLIFYFQQNGCSDPQNLADEVFLRALRRSSEGAEFYSGVNAFCYGIAQNVLREERRRPRHEELPEELPPAEPHLGPGLSRAEQAVFAHEFLNKLPPDEIDILVRYHLEDRAQLAHQLNVSPNGLRIRVCRITQKVREALAGGVKRMPAGT